MELDATKNKCVWSVNNLHKTESVWQKNINRICLFSGNPSFISGNLILFADLLNFLADDFFPFAYIIRI